MISSRPLLNKVPILRVKSVELFIAQKSSFQWQKVEFEQSKDFDFG